MPLKAMLFDMDGTITRPRLDFPAIKREIGIPADAYILEALETMPAEARHKAMAILERHEMEAAQLSELNPGARLLLEELRRRTIVTGIITRNSAASVDVVLRRHGLTFTVIVCREDAPPKPAPEGLLMALQRVNVAPREAVYVGDHPIDLAAGKAAGTRTIWVTNGREAASEPQADFVVSGLAEIVPLLEQLARQLP